MKSDIIKRILRKVKQYEEIVIARHVGPDPDAICSQLALRDAILERYPILLLEFGLGLIITVIGLSNHES